MFNRHQSQLILDHAVKVTTGSTYTAKAADAGVEVNKASGSATAVTMPPNPAKFQMFFVKDGKGDAATNNITITPASGNIDGSSNYVIANNYGGVNFYYNGTEWKVLDVLVASGSTDIGTIRIPLLSARNNDGTVIAGSASSGKLGISDTPGTSLYLVGNATQNTTSTDICQFETVLPQTYNAGQNVTLTINAKHVESSGTTLTNTILPKAYLLAKDGTMSADLIGTTATAITGTAVDYSFTITGTTLTPGARLLLQLTSVATEGGNTGTTKNEILSVRLS